VQPSAGVWTVLLEVSVPTVISTLRACAVGGSNIPGLKADRIDVRLVSAGEAESGKQYRLENVPVPRGFPYAITEGWTLLGEDRIYVRSLLGLTAFSVSGVEKN